MIRISCPGALLDAPKLESSKIWTTRRLYRHPVAGGGTPHLQQSSPPGGFRKMLPKFSATLTMLSHGATTPPLCPSQFETSYRRPNFGHRTGSLRQIVAGKSLPAPASCLYRSARRFYLPPSRIAGSDLYPGGHRSPRPGCRCDAPGPPGLRPRSDRPGRLDLAPGWHPGGRPAAAGGRPAAVQYCGRVQLWNNLAAQF